MRHRRRRGKLNRTSSHRLALAANMGAALVMHEQIKTTLPKARMLRPFVEKLVTKARTNSLHNRRLLIAKLRSLTAVDKLFNTLGARYMNRNGGYLRIIKCAPRHGDNAPMAVIEFVDRDEAAKGAAYAA